MTKVEQLQKKHSKAKAAEAENLQLISKKERELESVKQEESAAAVAGDLATYRTAKDKRIALEDEIFVCKAKNPYSDINRKDILDAWSESVAEYKDAVDSVEDELEKATSEMVVAYRKLVAAQCKMLKDREECASFMGLDPSGTDGFYGDKYRDSLPVKFVEMKSAGLRAVVGGHVTTHTLTAYLAASGKLNADDIEFDTLIFRNHRLD